VIHGVAGHTPVAADRFLELVAPALARPDAVFVDATVGLGGHSRAVATRFPDVRMIGLDRDAEAVRAARAALGQRAEIFHAEFSCVGEILRQAGLNTVDAVLFDLGVSSYQLDSDSRGFAYSRDTPLDMRMDPTTALTAAEILRVYSRDQLARVLRDYGEERFAKRIADRIVAARAATPIERSGQLVELIRGAIPAAARRAGGNPAKRTFQALRVEVNGELEQIESAFPAAIERLNLGGRIVAMSYQSLEDALVKAVLRRASTSSAPPGLPVEPQEAKPQLKLLTRGAEQACEAEREANPRSASLRLRAAVRIREVVR
jgi:16S rRNA (cytosine1402-N4)-methyltransferase